MPKVRVQRKQVVADLKSSPVCRELEAYLDQLLEDEREKYELNVASEFQRGRISMLRDVRNLTKE